MKVIGVERRLVLTEEDEVVKRLALLFLGLAISATSLQGCISSSDQTSASGKASLVASQNSPAQSGPQGPIAIGLVTELTGSLAETGEAQAAAIKMAVDEWNEKGGINGRTIELAIEDDGSNPMGAVNALNKLISNNKPVALFGPTFTNFLTAMEPNLKKAAIPLVTGATGPSITSSGNPWFFRVRTSDAVVGKLVAQIAVNELGFKKIGIIHVTGEFGNAGANVVRESLEKLGVPPLGVEDYNPGDKDVTPQLRSLQKAGAELVIGWGFPPDAAVVMAGHNRLGLNMKLLGSPSYATPETLSLAKQAANGTYAAIDWLPSGDQATQSWVTKMEAKQKPKVDFINAVCYDGANILFKAIEQVGTDPQEIRKAILATKGYKGITGEYSFSDNGDGLHQMYVAQIKNEKPELGKVVREQQ